MSSLLSMDSEELTSTEAQKKFYVPFVAHVRLVPNLGTGKRADMLRNLQKAAKRAETSIQNATDNNLFSRPINIASPIAWTPQFGDYSARLTIIGFVELDTVTDRHNAAPTTNVNIIHSGTDQGEKTSVVHGNHGGSLSEAQDPTAAVVSEASALRLDLAVALSTSTNTPGLPGFVIQDIMHIEYSGVKFGTKKQGGRSFA